MEHVSGITRQTKRPTNPRWLPVGLTNRYQDTPACNALTVLTSSVGTATRKGDTKKNVGYDSDIKALTNHQNRHGRGSGHWHGRGRGPFRGRWQNNNLSNRNTNNHSDKQPNGHNNNNVSNESHCGETGFFCWYICYKSESTNNKADKVWLDCGANESFS